MITLPSKDMKLIGYSLFCYQGWRIETLLLRHLHHYSGVAMTRNIDMQANPLVLPKT
jgi:hypothetical protein